MSGLRALDRAQCRSVLVELAAPRGFGAAYRRAAKEPAPAETLCSLLSLVGYETTAEAVELWSIVRRVQAEVYAINVHLRASDNALQRHPRPEWMPEPWQGPRLGEGVFEAPGGTPL